MPSLTVRNLDADVKHRLRIRAAQHGHSMEEEVRTILRNAVADRPTPKRDLGTAIRERMAGIGGVELELPPRTPLRDPPTFD
jgi:plasmid stability protein